jgi:predicted nucleic acid-binding protein
LTDEVAEELVTEVLRISTSIGNVPLAFEYPRDPKDEPYLNLAIATNANYLTSRDKDLLDLMKDRDFTTRFPAISVLDPTSLLREIEREQSRERGPEA